MYDIGEVDGQPYLSMEYIDGEDLGSLLRRIGRLPADKATEFARKLCAAVAAAHGQGVLDRKSQTGQHHDRRLGRIASPTLDWRQSPRGGRGDEIRSGTPAYMAPEQLTGTEVSAQSDLYAVGLAPFYQMFTGKMPFEANTIAEMTRLRQENRVTSPSTLTRDLDKAVEMAILRCLDSDPNAAGICHGAVGYAAWWRSAGRRPGRRSHSVSRTGGGGGLARSAFSKSCDSGPRGNRPGLDRFLCRDSPFSLNESGSAGTSGSSDREGAGHPQEFGLY